MNFTDTGTLIEWKDGDLHIIPPLHTNEFGKVRGGAFLCIPNFEDLNPPFTAKHGEYRNTVKENILPHHTTLTSSIENTWGSLDVTTKWQEVKNDLEKKLIVTVIIKSLSETAIIRPGFHPYFSTDNETSLIMGENTISLADIPEDALVVHKNLSSSDPCLHTAHRTITVTTTTSIPVSVSYGLWSDNKESYLCVEPIIGDGYDENNMPLPIRLKKDQAITIDFTITVTPKA